MVRYGRHSSGIAGLGFMVCAAVACSSTSTPVTVSGSGGSSAGGSIGMGGSSSVGGNGGAGGAGTSGGNGGGAGNGGAAGGAGNGGAAGGAGNGGAAGGAMGGAGNGSIGGSAGLGGASGDSAGAGGSSAGSGGTINPGTKDITVWLSGDSTVAQGSAPCAGWGQIFQAEFNEHVTVKNLARGGRSIQTWLYDVSSQMVNGECRLNSENYLADWAEMLEGMQEDHALLIQFGINDGSSSCDRHVGTDLFKSYLGMMAEAARERGANPIFVTPVSSISCSGNMAVGSRGTYARATKEAGSDYDVPVIDLEQLSVNLYNELGFCPLPGPDTASTFQSGEIGDFFCNDHTHFEEAGAIQIGGLVAHDLVDQGLDLGAYVAQ